MARERVSDEHKRPGAPTIRDVAKHAGVSTATVSRVLNGFDTVEAGLAQRVRASCEVLRYRPKTSARMLAGGRSMIVALVIPNVQNSFFMEVVSGAEAVLQQHTYLPILCSYLEDARGVHQFAQFIDLMITLPIAGAIVVPLTSHHSALKLLWEHQIPVVSVDHRVSEGGTDSVMIDNVAAAREAVGHLIANGYRRIGAISGPAAIMTGRDRMQGYRLALQDAGIAEDPALMRHGPFLERTGHRHTNSLLAMDPPIDALFTANLTITTGALQALYARGVRVPQDIALAGFDIVPSIVPGIPPLTTIVQPAKELGATAARRLMQRLKEPGPHVRQDIVLAHHLRVGESSRSRQFAQRLVAP